MKPHIRLRSPHALQAHEEEKRKETKTLMEENTCKMVYAFAGVVNRHLSVKAGTLDASQS